MKLISSAFDHEGMIPAKYTCDGENVSPSLAIEDVPEKAQSLALIMDDPDAPAGTFVHWVVWNIPVDAQAIAEGVLPEGAQEGETSFGKVGYGGPCPPSGTHRYFFKLYALDQELELSDDTDKGALLQAMEGHVVAQAEFMGRYARQ